jgi:hypothetical protein
MKVAELIEQLRVFPQDSIVILQKDAEGNGFSPLDGLDVGHYVAETAWYGEVPAPEDDDGSGDPCVVLWPVN